MPHHIAGTTRSFHRVSPVFGTPDDCLLQLQRWKATNEVVVKATLAAAVLSPVLLVVALRRRDRCNHPDHTVNLEACRSIEATGATGTFLFALLTFAVMLFMVHGVVDDPPDRQG